MGDIRKEFGRRMAQVRESRGIKVPSVAISLDVIPQQIYKYENGEGWPSPERLVAIAGILSCNIHYLLTGRGSPDAPLENGGSGVFLSDLATGLPQPVVELVRAIPTDFRNGRLQLETIVVLSKLERILAGHPEPKK